MAFYSTSATGGGLGNIPFKQGDFVWWVDAKQTYFCIADGIGGRALFVPIEQLLGQIKLALKWRGAFDNSIAYDTQDAVFFSGSSYISLQSGNANHPPDSSPQWWDLMAEQGAAGPGADHFTFTQSTPASVWVINHNLNRIPAVVVEDSSHRRVEGDVVFTSLNTITISFTAPFSGVATLV